MSHTQKQPLIHFRMEDKLVRKLDKRIERARYTSRSDFFTAVAYVTLYGSESLKLPLNTSETENIQKLPEHVTSWIHETTPKMTEEEILTGLYEVIEKMLYPVIAMKGVDVAYENTWADVRAVFHERFAVWVTESDVREAFMSFAAIHRAELSRYREKQMMLSAES